MATTQAVEVRVTLRGLLMRGACTEGQEAFDRKFPNGATLREVVAALADHRRGLGWFRWLYLAGFVPHPIWRAFLECYSGAYDAHTLTCITNRQRYDSGDVGWDELQALQDAASEIFIAAQRETLRRIAATL